MRMRDENLQNHNFDEIKNIKKQKLVLLFLK